MLIKNCSYFIGCSGVRSTPFLHVKNMVWNVVEGKCDDVCSGLKQLYDLGYSPTDIITILFRIMTWQSI